MSKKKYAYTYEIYRHVNRFMGPFDSYEDMIKDVVSLVNDDENGISDMIQDYLLSNDLGLEDIVSDIHTYEVSESHSLSSKEIAEKWKEEMGKKDKRFKKEIEEMDRLQYEHLKKKFEDS